jgi:hypothetical protein
MACDGKWRVSSIDDPPLHHGEGCKRADFAIQPLAMACSTRLLHLLDSSESSAPTLT